MKLKAIAMTTLMASVALGPMSPMTSPARADGKDFIAGAIVGGIIGGAIVNENNKKKKATKSTKTGVSSETREQNKEVQTALNYFGYPAGTPDGAIGPKSRAAISQYQAFLGYPATGELTEHERTILVTAYYRAVAGGPTIAATVSGSPLGLKAVLVAQRDEMAGVSPTIVADSGNAVPGSVAEAAAAALPTLVPVTEPVTEVAEVEEEAALPSFISTAGAKGSLAEECNQVGVKTSV
ncbi:MAG: peptidoglycan-binding protein, partial [Rhodobacterales bacterium 17-64-5]